MASINKETVRVFDHPVLDWMSKAHPAFPAMFWGPIAVTAIVLGATKGVGALATVGLVLGGILTWTLFEYILHRWVFHFIPKNSWLRKQWYLVHQIHHDYTEWYRLVAPPMMSLALGAVFFTAFTLTLGFPNAWPFFAGFTIGYLAYDYVHFYTHFAKPKTRFGKMLRRNHQQHHHVWHDRWYGVSSPLWDYVFRTHVRAGERAPRNREEESIDWGRPGVAKSSH